MKNKKLLKAIAATIVCSTMGIAAFSFAACDDNNGGETKHYHTFSKGDKWQYDGIDHWRYATCGHDLIMGKAPHEWEGNECSVCGATKKLIQPTMSEEDEVPPTKNPDGTISVKYEFNASDYEAITYDESFVSSIFTIGAGTTLRGKTPQNLWGYNETKKKWEAVKAVPYTKSVKMGGSADSIEINAPAAGTFIMHVANGSSSVKENQLAIASPSDSKVESIISYYGENASGPCIEVQIAFDKAGKYKITRNGGTSDIYYMSYSADVEDTDVESISVASAGTVNYYVGQEFNPAGLAVSATHETTGRVSPLDSRRLEIDYTAFNSKKSGTYEIGVSYTKAGHTYQTNYNVNVYSFDDLTLGTDKIVKSSSNTSSDNGVYENISVRQLYFTGDTLSTNGLSVILNGGKDNGVKNFLLKDSQYTISSVDLSTPGKKSVTVSCTTGDVTKSKTFDVYVIDKDAALATALSVDVVVDAAVTDANVGVKNGDGAYQFKTVHQALEFLENSGVGKAAKKTITLAEGKYWEKLEVKVPNLTVIGAGKDKTTIEYDALYGAKDAGGFEHVTDSTATLNVREAAENFTIKGVNISNYYNTLDSYKGAPSTDQRALAVLIQADKVTFEDCSLLGYQDTLELFKGRQYFVNCYISGTTDFIFGTNNTTYFEKCQIHSIYNGSNDGGYVTAFKGCNKDPGSGDYVTYGAIFDQCHFTADEEVIAVGDEIKDKNGIVTGTADSGHTAIGRTWGPYAAVAIINCELDGHISTKTGSYSRNDRYVSMNGSPADSTVKFREYNNTGEGAITTKVNGMEFLSETEAANYSDFAVIFGTTNGKVTYTSVWTPIRSDVQAHTVTVKNSEGTPLFELQVEHGDQLTLEKLAEKLGQTDYAMYNISGVYSDSDCKVAYTYPDVSADGEIYLTLEEGPFTQNDEFVFTSQDANNVVTEGTKYIRKLKIDANEGSFVWHGGGWSKLTGNATMTLKLQADTRIAVTSHDNGLAFSLNGQPLDVDHVSGTYTVDVRTAGDLVIQMKNGAPQGVGYVGKVTVTVNAGLSSTQSYVKVYSGEDEVSSFQVWDGDKVNRAKIDAIKEGVTPPEGQAFLGYFSDDACTTPFNFDNPVTAETKIYIGWEAASPYFAEDTTITFGTAGNYKNYLGTKLIKESGNIGDHGTGDCEIPQGTSISIQVKAGTKIIVSSWDGFTCYKVKIDDDYYKENDADTNGTRIKTSSWIYTADKDCKITFIGDRLNQEGENGGSNYFYSISIEVPAFPGYAVGDAPIDFTAYDGGVVEGNTLQWGNVELDATAGKVQYASSNAAINCNVGTVIKFKVASGVTADNIVVVDYKGNDIPVADGIWDITVNDGVASVECKKSGDGDVDYRNYIKYIKIV